MIDTNSKEVSFHFKKDAEGNMRDAVKVHVDYPSVDGIVAILENGDKELELLNGAIEGVINTAIRAYLSANVDVTSESFVDNGGVSWSSIANKPKAQRGGGIPKEVWVAFEADYVEVMPEVTGKTMDQVANAAKILKGKLAQVKTNEPVLKLLVSQLALYMEHSANAADYAECVTVLLDKADTYLNVSEEELLSAL